MAPREASPHHWAPAQSLTVASKHHQWQEGEIAFLSSADYLSEEDYKVLIQSRYVEKGALGHPALILALSKDGSMAAITTISAYHAGPENGYLPPWRQNFHSSRKQHDDFRAFEGSQRPPGSQHATLKLDSGRTMPKPRASWIYIRNVWAVPVTALVHFDKSRDVLRVSQPSLKDLVQHMKRVCPGVFGKVQNGLRQNHVPVDPNKMPQGWKPTGRISPPYRPAKTKSADLPSWRETTTVAAKDEKSAPAASTPTAPAKLETVSAPPRMSYSSAAKSCIPATPAPSHAVSTALRMNYSSALKSGAMSCANWRGVGTASC